LRPAPKLLGAADEADFARFRVRSDEHLSPRAIIDGKSQPAGAVVLHRRQGPTEGLLDTGMKLLRSHLPKLQPLLDRG
jgi:hypothetical protein